MKTNLLSSDEWSNFPDEYFTPVEKIATVVLMLVEGKDEGTQRVKGDNEGKGGVVLNGRAVEISGEKHYFREMPPFCDDAMKAVMGATEIEELKVW